MEEPAGGKASKDHEINPTKPAAHGYGEYEHPAVHNKIVIREVGLLSLRRECRGSRG